MTKKLQQIKKLAYVTTCGPSEQGDFAFVRVADSAPAHQIFRPSHPLTRCAGRVTGTRPFGRCGLSDGDLGPAELRVTAD